MPIPSSSRREATPGALRAPARRRLRLLAALVATLTAAAMLLTPSLAGADSSSTLTVVGTSDVSDSGLIPTLIEPEFHAAYPQYTFKYIGTATGTAIADAENGSVGASALIVHAASLENQFVAGGYSDEPFGRAIWTNDFVLAGPSTDPAGVGANAPHNIVQAFADTAAAGNAGTATFVSRGGTPGTTVEEHQIWTQVDSTGLAASVPGLSLCAVPSTLGGGETPIAAGGVSVNGQPCPGGVLPGSAGGGTLPAWYKATGLTQGPNVVAANACTGTSGVGASTVDCYVFTDRGTYDYLASGTSPSAGTTGIPSLTILTRNDSASAPGGANELTNYFHAYIINPAKSPSPVNLPAAQAFVNFITSPTVQGQLSSYLNDTGDPGGPPFVADASPAITATGFPGAPVAGGQTVTVTGTVTNQEPGFTVPANQTISVDELVGGVPVAVASSQTNAVGGYSITFTPPSSGTYQVSTGLISLVENASLNPVYADELSPGASPSSPLTIQGSATITTHSTSAGSVQVAGSLLPAAPDANGTATLLARPRTSTGAFRVIGTEALAKGQSSYAINGALAGGNWTVEAQYTDPGSLNAATTAALNVTVPANSVKVSFGKLKLKKGKVTLGGKLSQGPTSSGAVVRLYAVSLAKVSVSKQKTKTTSKKRKAVGFVAARKKAPTFREVAKATIRPGRTTYTIKHRFKRGYRYVLQLRYVHKGQTSTYSSYKYLDVH